MTTSVNSSSVYCNFDPNRVEVRSALSGRLLSELEYTGNETPYIAFAPAHGLLFVYSALRLRVYDVRGVVPVGNSELLSETPSPYRHYALGPHPVHDFALSPSGDQIATIESSHRKHNGRTQIRVIDTATREQLQRFALADVGSGLITPEGSFHGNYVTFVDEATVLAAAQIPGNIFALSPDGVSVPSARGIDAVSLPTSSHDEHTVRWNLDVANVEFNSSAYRPAIALQFPRRLSFPAESLKVTAVLGSGSSSEVLTELELGCETVAYPGWLLLTLPSVQSETLREVTEYRLDLSSEELQFALPGEEQQNADTVVCGQLLFLPFRDHTEKQFPLGPLAVHPLGGLTGVVNYSLVQWDETLAQTVAKPWSDWIHASEDINSVATGGEFILAGTDSGVVVLFGQDGNPQQIGGGTLEKFDPNEAVSATALAANGHVGMAGNRRGRLVVYDLSDPADIHSFEHQQSFSSVSALALTPNGAYAASARNDGTVQYWRVNADSLELLFELPDVHEARCTRIIFAPDGAQLYFLRSGERGVRCLDIEALRRCYAAHGINW
ncbi:MAG: hypothetical protein R3C18_07225 [Planctomycetaceae bacterium]